MQKCNRREAMIFLLGGLAAIGGSHLHGKSPAIRPECARDREPYRLPWDFPPVAKVPERGDFPEATWLPFPYGFESLDGLLR